MNPPTRNNSKRKKPTTEIIDDGSQSVASGSEIDQLRSELERYKMLFDESEQSTFVFSLADLSIENANRNFGGLVSADSKLLRGKSLLELFHSSCHKSLKKAIDKLKSTRQPLAIGSIDLLVSGGAIKQISLEFSVIETDSSHYARCRVAEVEPNSGKSKYGYEYDLIFDSNPNPIWYKDTQNNYISVNNAAARLMGVRKEDIEGKNASALFPNHYLQYYKEDLHVIDSLKPIIGMNEVMHTVGGKQVSLVTDKIPILNEKGEVVRIAVFATDVTEKLADEERIHSVSQELELIFESIPASLWYKDMQNNFIRVNKGAADLIGLPKSEIEGRNAAELFPLDYEKYYTDDLEIMNSGLPKFNIFEQLTTKSGSLRWMQTDKIPLRDRLGNITGLLVIAVDITQSKITEEALHQSELRFSEFADMLPYIVFETDPHANIIYLNQAGFREFGFDSARIKNGLNLTDILDNAKYGTDRDNFFARFAGEAGQSTEYIFKRTDGTSFPCVVLTNIIENKHKPIGLRGVLVNVENLKQTQEALSQSEELMRTIFEKSAIGMTISYLGGRFYRVNQAFCSILMYSESELLRMNSTELTHPDDVEHSFDVIESLIKGYVDFKKFEKRYIRSDGRTIWTNVTMTVVRNASLMPLFIASQIEDITEQKQIALALRDSEEKYRNLTGSLPVGVYRTTPQGKILFANGAVARMLGYNSPEELYYINVSDTYARRGERSDFLKRFTPTSGDVSQEILLIGKDGKEIWLSDQGHPVFDESGNLLYIDGILENITEKRIAEKALRESESRFRMLFEKAPLGYQSLDESGNFLDVNSAWLELFGYDIGEVVGHHFTEFVSDESKESFFPIFQRFLESGESINAEFIMKKKDNSRAIVSFNGKVGRDANGVFKQTHSILRDVTQSKMLETQLISLKEFYETIVENVNDGIMVFDEFDSFTYVNSAIERIAEIGRADLLGNSFKAVFHRYLESEFINIFDRTKLTLQPTQYDEEFVVKRKSNSAYYNGWIIPLTDGGEYKGMIVTMQDNTERKHQENNLDKRNRILQAVALAAELLMKSADFGNAIGNVLRLLGEASNSDRVFLYKYDEEHLTDNYHLYREWVRDGFNSRNMPTANSESTSKKYRFSHFLRHYEDEPTVFGTVNEFPKQFQVLFEEKGIKSILTSEIRVRNEIWGYIGFDDCTRERVWTDAEIDTVRTASFIIEGALERLAVIEALQVGDKQLREAIKSKDKFLNIIAHDLRGPFSGFIGLAEILTKDIQEMSLNEITKITTEMHKTSLRLFALLENLLEWSRTQTGRIEFNPQMVDLHYIVMNKFNLYSISAAKKHIRLVSEVPPDTYLCADIHMLKTILRNLLNNAVKFIPDDESANNSITISATEQGEFLEIAVADTGIGISEEDIPKLFRIDISHISINNSAEKGTGLGLILCREFTNLHGGAIICESAPGLGTTFRFTFPRSHDFYRNQS